MISVYYKNKKERRQDCYFLGILIGVVLILSGCNPSRTNLHICGPADHELTEVLRRQKNLKLTVHEQALEAAQSAKEGEGLIVLAGAYPAEPVELDEVFFRLIRKKKLRAYLEYPASVPGIQFGKAEKTSAARVVVSSGFFSRGPDSLSILSVNGMRYFPAVVPEGKVHLAAAKVAGFDSAIYGLPAKQSPVLIEMPSEQIIVATTCLSRFISGRYAPAEEWKRIWMQILEYVAPGVQIDELQWEPVVAPTCGKTEELPEGYQKQSLLRGVEWYKHARMLIPSAYRDTLSTLVGSGTQRLSWKSDIPAGDGSEGIFECIFSEIDENGSQPIGIMERGDCTSETAMAFAMAGNVFNDEQYRSVAANLLDYYLVKSDAVKNEYANPSHGAYGLIPWGISNYAWYRASYGDDNARFLLAAWATAALTGTDRWDETLMKSLVALLRTTGKNGFRGSRIDLPDFEKNGWKHYFDGEIVHLSPHFESYLWACFLWAYDKTGDQLFLDRAERGIQAMMDVYPHGWSWTNGLAQERARMILPLAWLVRISDTSANRELLSRVVSDFLELQDSCGAIREELGDIRMGLYPPPQSNEAYGTREASLIARNGDPVSALLYTTNFAFLGLHEAARVMKDPKVDLAVDRLAEFLCRIQVKSPGHPELDGGWMRAFDYKRFEHWGSNADHGWGAWSIETGWTQGWITAILAMREMDTSLWELTKDSKMAKYYPELKKTMLKGAL